MNQMNQINKRKYRATGGNRALLNDYHRKSDSLAQWQINFLPYSEQTYAFDYLGSGNHGIYSGSEYYPYLSANYDLRFKSVECGKTDKVVIDFGSYPEKDSIVFKDKYGITLKLSNGNILNFTGVAKPDTNYIYAYRGDQKIGKLFLNTYQQKTYKVVFVRVNGAAKKLNAKEITKYLNKVYNQCAVSFEDSIDDITIDNLTSFSHGGSGVLTVYNDDQKKVLQAYDSQMQDGVYYLFFIDNVTDKKDGDGTMVSGYMPRGYNCGFIYDGGSPHTIAHELGHGIAGLEHVFENSKSSGKTKNLMDYASGEELWHFQWDEIQDPSRVWMKWNKDESEGEVKGPIDKYFVEKLWSSMSYAERISEQKKDSLLDNGYEKIYEKHTECGKLQEGYASKSHKDSFEVIFNKLPEKYQKDKYVLDKFDFFKKLSEEQVLNIYKIGYKSIFDKVSHYLTTSVTDAALRLLLTEDFPYIGSNDVLSDSLQKYVYLAFESKTKCPITLSCLEGSKQSQDLHIHYLFQKEYYIPNFIEFIYNNLDNVGNLDDILKNKSLPNFSFVKPYVDLKNLGIVMDISSNDYYGLFGGTQRLLCDLVVYQKNNLYLADIKLTIVDWYGSDLEDICTSSLKSRVACLNAFFFLQHHFGYNPFQTQVIFHDYVLFTKKY